MKNVCIVFLLIAALLLTRCAAHKKVAYNIPATYTKEQTAEFLARMEKGATIYKANCGGCHGIFSKGRDNVPNFTHDQVDAYSASFLRGDPKNHAVASKMSPDQFLSVLSFLSSRKVDKTLKKINVVSKPAIDFK